MCGIAGAVRLSLDIPRLTKDLWHRGPDAQSTWSDKDLVLHHHRLAILDIASGSQPMHLEHLTIIFNGEIYNHQEVRERHGLKGKTHSDTETILLAFLKLGPACLFDFDGMFAFAIYDHRTNRLFLARDRAGKKPLYYYEKGGRFAFASELNALQAQVQAGLCEENITRFLHYGAFHGSATPYREIRELPPGHFAWYSLPEGPLQTERWWQIGDGYNRRSTVTEKEALEEVDQLLHRAVKRRLDSSDLEVGSFLSGGIDSGLVTAIAAGYKPGLKTFTVSFTGSYDEAPLAKLVADKYQTGHTEIKISFDELSRDIEKILSNYGEPFYDDSAIPSYYVSREARKHLTVILNGDGSDEIFGGYRRYVPFAKYDFFRKPALLTGLAGWAKKIIPISHDKQTRLNYLYRLADLASQKGTGVYYSSTTDIFTGFEDKIRPLTDPDPVEQLLQQLNQSGGSGLQKMMEMDFNCILPDILLVKMDIATMAHSLEGRSPFLSKELLEYVPGLPDDFKIRGTRTKYLLRRLAEKYLPDTLVGQPKRGFEVPLRQWVDKELKELIFDYLLSADSVSSRFVSPAFIGDLLERRIRISDEKRAKMLYTLFALDVWYKKAYLPFTRHTD